MWTDEEAQRYYASQASGPSSRPVPPANFPEPNVPGSGGGGFSGERLMAIMYTEQGQQTGHQRPSFAPPSQFPVPPTYPTSGYAAIPRLEPAALHLEISYVDYPRPPAAHPRPQVRARAPEHSAHPPPYHHDGGFVLTLGPPDISEPLYPLGTSDQSYQFSHASASERAHQQPAPNPPNFPSNSHTQPQRRYELDREFQAQRHAQLSRHYTPRVAQRRALLVGIDYSMHPDHRFRLNWGVNDAYEIARFLQERCGFRRNDIRILTDDQHDNLPTKANILAAMHWLVNGAQPGDSLFFYFSGHATQVKDLDGDERDGYDECLCTMEYTRTVELLSSPTTPGIIVDDHIHDIMVKPLPRGCRLTAVLDCCHSGTLFDLPFIYDSRGNLKPCDLEAIQLKSSEADVISLSACKDSERAFEAREGGALRKAFIEYMMNSRSRGSYFDVIRSLRAYMRANHFKQKPQLSSSHGIDIDQQFVI